MRFPDGATLCVGTVSCDDQIHQAVYLSYTAAGADAPTMELELPPKSVEVIIRQLQDYVNQARFVNGERMLEYPEPYLEKPRSASSRTPKVKKRKTKKRRQGATPDSSPATQLGNSGVAEGPPSVS